MNRTTSTRRTPGSRTARVARSIGISVAAAATTVAITAGLGLGPSAAQADPGDTFVALGSSQLVQSEDLVAIQIRLDTEQVLLGRNDDFSSCLGEGNRWTDVLPGADKPVTGVWTSHRRTEQALYESIGQAKTPAQAKRYAKTLLREGVRNCQGTSSPWDFHYGPTSSSGVGSGSATWAVSYRGTSTRPDGGVAVFSRGTTFGIVHVSGTWGPAEPMMESVAKVAVDRLVG